MNDSVRIEKDSLGEVEVPASAYYGAQTQRAVENFPISGIPFPRSFLSALGIVKSSCARANQDLDDLDPQIAGAIVQAADELRTGELDAHFPVDIFQTGSGTSTNMNANEVLSNRAIEILGGTIGSKSPVHPNDHVNRGQSSNDVIPTTSHVAVGIELEKTLLPALDYLEAALTEKAQAWDGIVKTGRTHLMDATPVRLGQVFSGYAAQVRLGRVRVEATLPRIRELALGGTAVGTGINTLPLFPPKAIQYIAEATGIPFVEANNHFEAQAARDALVEVSGALKVIACSLTKIANDIRFLGSGPRTGLGELRLPETQPGSSIMPGKVNPVICESVLMVCAQVIGNDAAVTIGGQGGNFELNVMIPVMTFNVLQSTDLLANSCRNLVDRCVTDLVADEDRATETVERNLAICTALAPAIGYDEAASISKEAHKTGRNVREVAAERGVLGDNELAQALDSFAMTERLQA
ncbi:MAG TPA: aspartate ammonia-lyase [Deltaproteobacteria bacterium]|nr:aspartate ammonia-lyase [Deltaproteobacteria bacterium]HCP47710.1 aspartate ammonia-lyase [Deltaproteobacteria bacterium]